MLSIRFRRLLNYAVVGRAMVLPAVVFALLATMLLGLWAMERRQANAALQTLASQAADLYAVRLESQLDARVNALQVLCVQWSSAARADQATFQGLAEPFLAHVPSLRAMLWADGNLHVRWVVPGDGGALRKVFDGAATPEDLEVLRRNAPDLKLTALRLQGAGSGASALAVLLPTMLSVGSSGYVGAILPALETDLLSEPLSRDFSVTLTPVNPLSDGAPDALDGAVSAHATVSLANLKWDLRVEPRSTLAERTHSPHNVTLLVAGLSLSLILAWMSRRLLLRGITSQVQEQRFKDFTDVASDWVWEVDANLRFTYISARVKELFGLDPTFFIGRTNWELPWPEESMPLVHASRKVLEARQPFRDVIIWGRNAEGERAAMRGSGRPVYDARGRFLGYRGTGSDVTAEMRAREQASQTNSQLLNALDHFPGGFGLFDPQERLVRWNDNLKQLFPDIQNLLRAGITMEVLVRATVEHYGAPVKETREERIAELLRQFRLWREPIEVHTRDDRWLQVHGRKADDGSTVVVIMEITRRKQFEEQTRQSEANLARAQQIARLGSWELDLRRAPNGQLARGGLTWSDQVYRIFGLQPGAKQASSATFFEVVHPDDRDMIRAAMEASAREGKPYSVEHRILLPDGTERVVHEQGELVRDAQTGEPVRLVGTVQDITERQRTEALLQEHQALLQAVFDAIPLGMFVKNRAGQFVTVNKAMARDMNVPVSAFVGSTVWPPSTPEEERLAIEEYDRQLIATGRGVTVVETHTQANGQKSLVRVIKQPILNAQGEITGLVGIAEDISERLAAERRKAELEGQLHQAQKMETIGRLAGGVAHDFNNLLTPILGHAQLALGRLSPEHPLYASLNVIQQAAVRAADLTRRLLAFSRKQVLDFRLTNLNDEVTALGHMLKRVIGEDIEVITNLDPDLGTTRADPSQLQQILMNLVVNARDAMPQGGKLSIKTSNAVLDNAYARDHKGVAAGPYVMLRVSDTGHGMDSDTQAHIFEPFYTTKEQGKGTGLGLSIVEGIVGQHHGHITVESTPDQGTTFTIYLPRASGNATAADAATAAVEGIAGTETVLVVEDEDMVRQLACSVLQQRGYRVLQAGTPDDALRIAGAQAQQVDLLLTDVVMPKMHGPELYRRMKALRPGLRVLYMSGHPKGLLPEPEAGQRAERLVQKPFAIEGLIQQVREVLDEPPAPA